MAWDIFKKEKKEPDEIFPLRLTREEKEFIDNQAIEECSSKNGIIRKAIKHYQKYIKTISP